eukprot:435812_1
MTNQLNTSTNDDITQSMLDVLHTLHNDNNDAKLQQDNNEIINLMTNADIKIISDLNKQIDDINDIKLNENKDKIIQYFKISNINYDKLKQMTQKEFVENISKYCQDKNIATQLEQIFKAMLLYIIEDNNSESKQQFVNEDNNSKFIQ